MVGGFCALAPNTNICDGFEVPNPFPGFGNVEKVDVGVKLDEVEAPVVAVDGLVVKLYMLTSFYEGFTSEY